MSARKKYNAVGKLKRAAVGIRITWSDETPMEESDHIVEGKVDHKNPMLRPIALKLWASGFGGDMMNKIPARWKITIKMLFRYSNGVEQIEERELIAYCVLTRINETALEQIQEMRRCGDMNHYVTTFFEVACEGI